jgi:CHASE1-domain containing sensor protein
METQTVDVPVWMGILMFIAGLAITIAMAKYVASREKRRSAMKPKSIG